MRDLFKRIPDSVILLLFFSLILLQTIPSLRQKSATFDEVMRQFPGYLSLTIGEYWYHPDKPPLIKMLAAVPLLFIDLKLPRFPQQWTDETRWQVAHDFLYKINDADQLIFLGRLAMLPLSLLLGFFVFRWAKEIFGQGAAIFALFLYSFDPNILAHGRLMNTDLGVTCFIFLTIYGFYQLSDQTSLPRLLLTGLAFGLALVTKFSSLLLIPLLLLLGLGMVVSRHPISVRLPRASLIKITDRSRKLVTVLILLVTICLVGYSTVWTAYRFQYGAAGSSDQSFHGIWNQTPEKPLVKQTLLWARDLRVLPEAYLSGLSRVLNEIRRAAFLMGDYSTDGWWYYFLVTFLLKTPLPLILLLAFAGGLVPRLWRERPIALLFLIVPALFYFMIASWSRLNIGHRHLLPIYPFLFVLAGALIPWSKTQRPLIKNFLGALALWYVVSSVSIFPHYLAYFNEIVGGPENGYKYLVDSNLDWGQDLKGLKRYMDERGIERVWLSYFGTASPDYYGIAYNHLPSYYIFNAREEHVPTPFVAISATNLQGIHLEEALGVNRDYFRAFRQKQPLAKIGYSIFIYKLGQ